MPCDVIVCVEKETSIERDGVIYNDASLNEISVITYIFSVFLEEFRKDYMEKRGTIL